MQLPTSTYSFIFFFVRQQWLKFLFLILSFIVWAVSDTFFPYFLKRIVNEVQIYHGQPAGIYAAVGGSLALLIAFWLVAEFFMRAQGILQIYTFPEFRNAIRESVFKYVKSHSHDYFTNHFAGNIAKKLADLPTSCQSVMEIICFQFVVAITGVIIVLIMMLHISTLFAGLLTVWLCIHFSIMFGFFRYGNQLSEVHSESVTTLSGKIVDVLSNMLNVRLFARGNYEAHYLKTFQRDEMRKAKTSMWLVEKMRIGLGLNGLFLIISMVFALLNAWSHQTITIGDFTQVLMQCFWLLGWLWFLSFQLTILAREVGTIANALSLVRKDHDLIDREHAQPILIQQGSIDFDNVDFYYQAHHYVFKNLSVSIPAGQKVGLVGFSGSGKSTFVNLILRFYDLAAGKIIIDGTDIALVQQESLRSQIALIPQDPALFHRSLLDNIRYGRLEASDAEVIQASKLAHCDEFITRLDDSYDSLVGERGVKLSGGQRQRIAIARAILKDAPILILDEATSSLDSVTEKLIQESLHTLMQNRTTIVVAHRLSTLADMDRILVFHHGSIIEEGSKETLLKMDGHFAKLWNMQTDGFLPSE